MHQPAQADPERPDEESVESAADALPQVFDLLMQGRQASDRSAGGLGLGLTIVRSLIDRHGGSVTALSGGPGLGSEFVIRLPRAKPITVRGVPAALDVPESAATWRPLRILIVDDNQDGAEMLSLALSRDGHQTRVAHDAPSALQAAAALLPEVAILDLGLPVIDGYELAAQLRNLSGLPDVRLIALTGYGQESDLRRTRLAGFEAHLVKPVDFGRVRELLNRTVQ